MLTLCCPPPSSPRRPEIFGLHENADITCDMNETYDMFATVLSLQPRQASGVGQSQEEVIAALAGDILAKLPAQFDLEAVSNTYPTRYDESMNTVLVQECIRYNNLLAVMQRSLVESGKALKGLVAMSPELEAVTLSMYDNQVRGAWAARGRRMGAWAHAPCKVPAWASVAAWRPGRPGAQGGCTGVEMLCGRGAACSMGHACGSALQHASAGVSR